MKLNVKPALLILLILNVGCGLNDSIGGNEIALIHSVFNKEPEQRFAIVAELSKQLRKLND